MAFDEALGTRIRDVLDAREFSARDIDERRMFGGLAFLERGRMFIGINGNELMVRVGPERHDEALAREHVRPMDFTGRPLRGFVYVSPPGFRTAAALRTWLSRGERVAAEKATEPTKRRPGRKAGSAVGRRRAVRKSPWRSDRA